MSVAEIMDIIALDTLIPGADQMIKTLATRCRVIFLTSRPQAMRGATATWLALYGLENHGLIMKPPSAQYTKTVLWKRDMVREIAMHDQNVLVFIDDEEANRAAIESLGLGIVVKASLEDIDFIEGERNEQIH